MTTPAVPGFEKLQLVSATSSTLTWSAFQTTLERTVLLRALQPGAPEAQQSSFERIARAFARIRHPNLIQVFDIVRDSDERAYLVLEAVEGETLADLLRNGRRLEPARVAEIGAGIAAALDTAWTQANLVHRNLKPESLCLTPEGVIKIVDFGAAAVIEPGSNPFAQDEGLVVGTPNYMAPEQAQGLHTLDYHADMYGLGALLYHLFTGVAPFAEESDPAQIMSMQVDGRLPALREGNPKVPAAAEQVLGRLLMKSPGARYKTWAEAVEDLTALSRKRALPRRGPVAAGEESTLKPFLVQAKKQIKIPEGGPRPQNSTVSTYKPESVPSGPTPAFKLVLWILLVAGLAWLADYRWKNQKPVEKNIVPAVKPVALQEQVETAPAEERVEEAVPDVAAQTAGEAEMGEPAAVVATVPAAQINPQVRSVVKEALRKGDLKRASAVLGEALGAAPPEAKRELEEVMKSLEKIGNPNDFLGMHLLERYRDATFTVNSRGRRLSVAPERYAAGLLGVQLQREGGGSHSWSLDLASLEAAERMRLLGPAFMPDEDDPAALVSFALLAFQANDAASLRRVAPRIPALVSFLTTD